MEDKAQKSFIAALVLVGIIAYPAFAASLTPASLTPATPTPAIPRQATHTQKTTNCATKLKEVLYSARFNWESSTPMQIRVGTTNTPSSEVMAIISSETGCQAICQFKDFVKNSVDSPVALSLTCRGAHFGALTTPATVLWSSYEFPKPTLRTGTWVSGFQNVGLRVELDRYSQPNPPARAMATTVATTE